MVVGTDMVCRDSLFALGVTCFASKPKMIHSRKKNGWRAARRTTQALRTQHKLPRVVTVSQRSNIILYVGTSTLAKGRIAKPSTTTLSHSFGR